MAIRVYLSDVLKERGMTSKELCAKVGITEANLSILRSGKASGVRFHTINKIPTEFFAPPGFFYRDFFIVFSSIHFGLYAHRGLFY